MRSLHLNLLLAIVFTFGASFARADASLETSQMLGYFSSTCPSQGQWTTTALGYANDLVQVLKTLASDPDCVSLNGALGQVSNLGNQIAILKQNEGQNELLGLQQQEQAIFLQLADPNTSETQLSIDESQLALIETQISSYQGFPNADQSYLKTVSQGEQLQTLVGGVNTLLSQSVANEGCLQSHPSVLSGIAALAGSVQAVVMTGGSSLITAAGADLLNNFVESARNSKSAKQINQMASTQTAIAYQCVMESLANQWCTSEDALDMIKLKGKSIAHPANPNTFTQQIEILDQELPMFLNWLTDVRAGTLPANSATAANQTSVYNRENAVRTATPIGLGLLAQNQPLFDAAVAPEDKWKVEKNVIDAIAFSLAGCGNSPGSSGNSNYGGCNSPLTDLHSAGNTGAPATWYLIGVPESSIPKSNGSYDSLDNYTLQNLQNIKTQANNTTGLDLSTFQPNLTTVKTQLTQWIYDARLRINTELALYVNLDPVKLLTDGTTPDRNGDSPYTALLALEGFMKSTPPTASTGSFNRIYKDTLVRLQIIQNAIDTVVNTNSSPATSGTTAGGVPDHSPTDATQALTNIQDAAVLDNGVGFLGDRLNWALKQSLTQLLITDKSGVDKGTEAQLLAADDIIGDLETYSGTQDLNTIGRDIEKSQTILEKTLENVTETFDRGIAQSIYDYEKQASQLGEDATGASSQEVAEMCLDVLASPQWPGVLPHNVCLGKSLTSVAFENGPSTPVITETLIHADLKTRMCMLRDYQRSNYIYQNNTKVTKP